MKKSDPIWKMVDRGPDAECWPWKGSINRNGYGMLNKKRAHRLTYEEVKGPIPDGLVLDHLCRNRRCVNPAHLEAVTDKENILRGEGVSAKNNLKTHCANGHEFSPENTYNAPSRPKRRMCRICYIEKGKKWKLNNPDKVAIQEATAYRKHMSIPAKVRRDGYRRKYRKYRKENIARSLAYRTKNRDEINRRWVAASKDRKQRRKKAVGIIINALMQRVGLVHAPAAPAT